MVLAEQIKEIEQRREALERCLDIEQKRIDLRNEEEKTQKEVADMLGISQSYISRLEKKIIHRLKKEMIKME